MNLSDTTFCLLTWNFFFVPFVAEILQSFQSGMSPVDTEINKEIVLENVVALLM